MLFPQGDATFSACGRYRYRLTRELGGKMTITFIMLNPSTADAHVDDPTIRRCKGFARGWGYGRLVIVNLFAFRATEPRDMWKMHDLGVDVVGEPSSSQIQHGRLASHILHSIHANVNDGEIWGAVAQARGGPTIMNLASDGNTRPPGIAVAAWGKGGVRNTRQAKIVAARGEFVAKLVGGDLWCLGTNEDGSPKHPLYLAEDTQAEIWSAA